MKRTGFILLCMLLGVSISFAQQQAVGGAAATFEKITHDFGIITEEGGSVTYQFTVKNTGKTPLVINRVSASCGCTTPEWTKEPIAPGKTGFVKATYNPAGRPGPFSKTISVYSNADPTTSVLTIKGEVTPKGEKPEARYPVTMGNLRLKENTLTLNTVKNTENRVEYIEVYNTGKTPMSLTFEKLPKYITATCQPANIPANNVGKIMVTYVGPATTAYGKQTTKFNIVTNNDKKTAANNVITVNATIVEDFSKLSTVQKENAPVINVSPDYINFGSVADKKLNQTLRISNSGKSNLIIRNIESGSDAITVTGGKKEVKPGEIVEFNLLVNAKKVTSQINTTLNIITNSPNAPEKNIRLLVKQ